MNREFDFMGLRKILAIVSLILVVGSIGSLATKGLSFGLDFTGGTLVEMKFEGGADLTAIRATLDAAGYNDATAQFFGSSDDVLVRVPPREGTQADKLGEELFKDVQAAFPVAEKLRNEFVGPSVGEELRDQSGLAMLMALGVMMLYISIRFTFKFGVGAVSALFHDVLIVLGFFSILELQFDLTVLAAVLAVIGYSLNDTVVVADRIRENFRDMRKGSSVDIINKSINQTLGRTLITSLTTLVVLIALYLLGGELLKGFSTALLAGVLVGTYSSIYVASTILLGMNVSKDDFIVVAKEDLPEMP